MVKNKKSLNKWLLIIPAALLITGGSVWALQNRSDEPKDDWQGGTNYRPPTTEEQSAGDKVKEDIIKEDKEANETPPDSPTSSKKTVDVVITDASLYNGSVEVRAFVPSYTADGTCTFTFTRGSRTFTRTSTASRDISSTICKTINVKTTSFPAKGTWSVIVSYSSDKAKGQSEASTFEVK